MALEKGFGGIAVAFKSRNYRVYWVGNFTHTVTVWIQRVAMGVLIWELTHSPLWLGIMIAAGILPTLFLGPFAGVTADRFGHRNQLVLSTYFGGAIAAVLTVLVFLDILVIGVLLGLVVLSGITRAFNVPARISMVSSLVDRQHLSAAIGINSATFHGGSFLGPVLAAFIITNFNISVAFLAYALGEFIAAASFMLLRIPPIQRAGRGKFDVMGDLKAGLDYALGHAGIRMLLILAVVSAIFLQPYLDMLPGFAGQVFSDGLDEVLTKELTSYLFAAGGAGAMVGGLWIARRGRMEGLVRIQITTLAMALTALILFSAIDDLVPAMATLVVVGFSMVTSQTCGATLIQNGVDPALRARVVSLNGIISVTGPAAGGLLIGWIAESLGLQIPVAAGAAIALLCLAVAARLVIRNTALLEATDDGPAAASNVETAPATAPGIRER